MKPVVIVAGRRAKHNPDKNRLTIQFLFPKQSEGKGDAEEIILINGDVRQIVVNCLEQVPHPVKAVGTEKKSKRKKA